MLLLKKIPGVIFFLLLTGMCNHTYSQTWKTYSDSAKVFADQKMTARAIEYYEYAREILRRDSLNTDTYIESCKNIAAIYFSLSNYNKAEPLMLEIKEKIEKIHGKENAANATNDDLLGQLYYKTDPLKAEIYFTEAKSIREKLFTKKSTPYAASCNSLGNLYSDIGENEKAETLYLEAKGIIEQLLGKDDPEYARNCNNLAAFYRGTGDLEKAETMGLEAKRIREKLTPVKQHPAYALTCTNLGNIYRDMGQYEKAELLYLEAKDIREKLPPVKEHLLYAASCNILADLYVTMKEYHKAEALYLEAKQIREKQLTNKSNEYASSCNNLASLYRDMGEYKKAESLALEAKAIWDKNLPAEHPSRPININNLGELYYAMGEYKKAETLFLEARKLWEKNLGKEHPYYFQTAGRLARVYWNMNEPVKAGELYHEAFHAQYHQLNKIFQFTNEAEKQLYLENINGTSDEYQSFYYYQSAYDKAGAAFDMSLLNRNLVLTSIQQTRQIIYNTGDTILAKKYSDWTSFKQQLAKLYSRGVASNTEEVKTLEEKSNLLEKELTRLSSTFKKQLQQQDPGWQNIQQILQPGEAAIEFVEFAYFNGKRWTDSTYYIALVLTKNKPKPELVSLFEKRQLDSLFKGAVSNNVSINSIYNRGVGIKRNNGVSRSAYNIIWKPLEDKLKGITKIYFAPAGLLHRVAFAALPASEQSALSDKYRLVQLTTTASVTGQQPGFVSTSDKIYLYGGIQYSVDSAALKLAVKKYQSGVQASRSLPADLLQENIFPYLPGTEKEINEIEKAGRKAGFSFMVFDSLAASEESVKSLNGKSSPAILHIATHGFFFPDPEKVKPDDKEKDLSGGKLFKQSNNPLFRSALLFAGANNSWNGKGIDGVEDGILTSYEVAGMYLPNTKLVVLSACETALGDIQGSEGVFGLQRAFKMAGVHYLVMSLWKVPDTETAAFMQVFYNNLFNKQSIEDAFHNAQATMKNKYRNEPYKWAAWVLIK